MKSSKNLPISKLSLDGLKLMTSVRFLLLICIIGSLLMYITSNVLKTHNQESLCNRPMQLQTKSSQPEDTLQELISAGWNCTAISIRMETDDKFNRSQHDISNGENQTNRVTFLIPNVVHYVWLGNDLTFTFIHYLSFLSVHRYIVPTYIFVYGELGPNGHWWNRTLHEVDNIIHVYSVARTHAPNGQPLAYKAHASDILRTEVIYKFGGIYLDTDVIVLKSFNPLRRYRTVMGRETSFGICNGILISVKGAPFIRMLLEQYDSYTGKNEIWAERSVVNPNTLYKMFSSSIHIENNTLQRPNWQELGLIYDRTYNWINNYSIHLWTRLQIRRNKRKVPQSITDINCATTTIGEIARHVYYGSKQRVKDGCPSLLPSIKQRQNYQRKKPLQNKPKPIVVMNARNDSQI